MSPLLTETLLANWVGQMLWLALVPLGMPPTAFPLQASVVSMLPPDMHVARD